MVKGCYFILLCSVYLIFAGCKKKKEYLFPEIPDNSQCVWLEDKDFVLDQRYLLNLCAGNDTLVVGGDKYLSLVNKQGKVIDHYLITPEGHNLFSAPSLSGDLAAFLSSDNETVSLVSVKNPDLRRIFKITDLDTSIAAIHPYQWRLPFFCINENIHKLLFFYKTHSNQVRYSLLDYSIDQDSIYLGTFNYFPPIDAFNPGFPFNVYPYKDNFMISFDYLGIHQMDKNGNLSASDFGNTVTSFIEVHDTLFAYCPGNKQYIYSTNNLNWHILINNFYPGNGPYYEINNSPLYIVSNQIGYLTINKAKGTYEQNELCNDGLETARINDMVLFRDSVYLASSTGLYLKPLSRFLKYKY